MLRKSSEFYIRVALAIIMVLLVVNLFKLPGHSLIERAVAAITTITGEGTTNYLTRFAGAAGSNVVGNSIIYDTGTNIGISTASPGYKLTIAGTGGVIATDNTATFLAKNFAGTYDTWMWPRWSDNIMYTNFGSAGWNIRNNSSVNVMFMQNGGNVGIGTTGPGYRLDVQGGQINTSGGLCIAGDCKTAWSQVTGSGVGGSGTANYIPKFTAGTTLGNSRISDDGSTITLGGEVNAGGGSGTGYTSAPIEVYTTANPRISFHWPGVVASQIGMDSSGTIRTYNNPGTGYENFAAANINSSGNITSVGGLDAGSNGIYNTFRTWTNLTGFHGIFSGSNGAHFYPNSGSYGSWRIAGSRNGWYGLEFDTNAGQTSLMMGGTANVWGNQITGMHNNSYGWLWYFNHDDLYADKLVDGSHDVNPSGMSTMEGIWFTNGLGNADLETNGAPLRLRAYSCCTNSSYITMNQQNIDFSVVTANSIGFNFNKDISAPGFHATNGWSASSGTQLVDCGGSNWICKMSSSIKYKKNIETASDDWSKILNVRSVNFEYKDKLPDGSSQPRDFGVIAEEVEKLGLGNLIIRNSDGEIESVKYDRMVLYLIPLVKEQRQKMEEQSNKISDLESRIEKLEQLINK